ncbi:MAG: DEAD/DEAH box helicase [Thermoflexales bacterium]|nr:DEAD/DEAH box helicase [Thermoflexales bacterium]
MRRIGFEHPTPIQVQAIPPVLQGRDIIGCAQTGTGKTAAFLLPSLNTLMGSPNGKGSRMLILVPTRELALQVGDHAKQLARQTGLKVAVVYGGVGMQEQERALRAGADVVVATPGRLLDHMGRHTVRFDHLSILVLDEADRMLDMGFLPDIRRVLRTLPSQRQTLLFSATMPAHIVALAREVQHDPVKVEVAVARPPEAIDQKLYPVPKHLKIELLLRLLERGELASVLVFTRTKHGADKVLKKLKQAGLKAATIHGDRTQGQRIAALEGFRRGQYRVLVATDIAARGIDVEGISHVLNFDAPGTAEDYVHRIGRTARFDASGNAITFITPADEPLVQGIQRLLGRKLERCTVTNFDYGVEAPSYARPTVKEIQQQYSVPRTTSQRWAQMLGSRRRH